MRTTLKLTLPLALSVAAVALLFAGYQVRTERQNLRNDLTRQAASLAESVQENAEHLRERSSLPALRRLLEKIGEHQHLKGIAIYDANGAPLAVTNALPSQFQSLREAASDPEASATSGGKFFTLDNMNLYVYRLPLDAGGKQDGTIAIFYDTSYITARLSQVLRDALLTALLQTILITGLALLLVRTKLTDPVARTAKWLRTLRSGSGRGQAPPLPPDDEAFGQLHREVTHLANDLNAARASAEEEARLRDSNSSIWTAERLRVSLRRKLDEKPLFVVANREPYMHVFDEKDHSMRMLVPASGLVTALEPVLLACDGTWVAHGSGSADRETADAHDRLRVPPDHPSYTLRRVWLTAGEQKGYYEGFSNEGLWPLCHIAHTRPIFRPQDWLDYQNVNRHFADAVLAEMEGADSPIVLVQDYHFALLPRMIKEARPDARVAIFWHIPWPNAEVFGICPWQSELVDGLLGADLIGFHIQSHCNNFLETVDRALEALTEWDRFAVNRRGHVTRVRPYPISVAFPEAPPESDEWRNPGLERAALCAELGIEASLLGVGVDRLDYTKGILERFRSVEHFLEQHPTYQRRFSLMQIGAPSRTAIDRYQQFISEVRAEAERINLKFQAGRWRPIVFLERHHSHEEISRYYRAASLCMVTSLHDGMNLVAKEFVASRDDDQGVLILSTFAGASHELSDALLVNPYDVQQVADSIYRALEMSGQEQGERMRRLRHNVREHNVYRWAANLLSDLTEIRVDTPDHIEAPPAS
jgi:trehalose-6-phosphate synthase